MSRVQTSKLYSQIQAHIKLQGKNQVRSELFTTSVRGIKGILLYQGFPGQNKTVKIGPREPVVKLKFYFPEKIIVHNFLSSSEMKMCEFFPENFAERVVILRNCPKGRQVT